MNEWIRITRDGQSMNIRPRVLERLLSEGWTIPGADQEPLAQKVEALPKDPGVIVAKPTKKKTAKSAENAVEAATEDPGNDITQGD